MAEASCNGEMAMAEATVPAAVQAPAAPSGLVAPVPEKRDGNDATTYIWVRDCQRSWELRSVLSRRDYMTGGVIKKPRIELSLVGLSEHGEEAIHKVTVTPADVEQWTHSQMSDYDDLTKMELHNAALLDLLRRRYEEDKIYTRAGNVIIVLEPFKVIWAL